MDLSNLTGTSLGSQAGLKDAQDARDKEILFNQLGKSSALIGAGLAKATPGAADSIFDTNIKNAGNRVEDYKANLANQDSDPKSSASQAMRGIAMKMGFKFSDNVSAADITKQIPQLQAYTSHQEHTDALRQTKGLTLLDQQGKNKEKLDEKQNKAYSELTNHLETFRGNRVAQQAALDSYSAKKAMDIVKNKDPNTLTTQDLTLLSGEMSKIATGGIPTEHGITALMPHNLSTKYAELQNFVLSKPSDANAAAYIKKNMNYLTEMTKSADEVLRDYRGNIARGYKGRIKPEQYTEAMGTYGLDKQSQSQQFTPDVTAYATAHGISPEQAQAIKDSRTGK